MIHSKRDQLHADLIGSFTVSVGDLDQCLHLWRYTGGFEVIDKSKDILGSDPEYIKLAKERGTMLRARHLQYLLAFSYWPLIDFRSGGNIYEIRSYRLQPGTSKC